MKISIYTFVSLWCAFHLVFVAVVIGQLSKEGRDDCPRSVPIFLFVCNAILLIGSFTQDVLIWRKKRRQEYEDAQPVIFESDEEGLDGAMGV